MGVVAIDQDRLLLAQLRPARAAMLAYRAALVVMHHDALPVAYHLAVYTSADRGDDTARLVPGDDRVGVDRQPADRRTAGFGSAVLVQVATAHPRGLYLDDNLAGPGGGVGKLHELDLPLTREHNTAHRFLRFLVGPWSAAYAFSGADGTPQPRHAGAKIAAYGAASPVELNRGNAMCRNSPVVPLPGRFRPSKQC